ncbi:hypothetical protein WME91_54635 [Sorangium sp. So ce269]
MAIAAAAVTTAVVMAVIVVWALGQRDAARTAEAAARRAEDAAKAAQQEATAQTARARASSLMAGARELLARNQPGPAVKLLLEVEDAANVRGWTDLTRDVLASTPSILTMRGHRGEVLLAAFSPDGQRIVTASHDRTARVWNADGSGVPVVLRGHEVGVSSAAFSADGQRLVTASDRTARVWALSADALRQALRAATTDCISPEMRRIYLDESDEAARRGYESCERAYGRTPFYPDAEAP